MEISINKQAATSERLLRAADQLNEEQIKFAAPALLLAAFTVFALTISDNLSN